METFLKNRVHVHAGDNREVIRSIPDNSIDSIVTDPPYALVSIVKRFGNGQAPIKTPGAYARTSAGFMGKQWDTGETAFAIEFWAECFRVLKPGGHVVAFGASRGYHRMACAIEDAGFEIRDSLCWLYGAGFPKSHDVSKGIDRAAGAQRAIISKGDAVKRMVPGADQNKSGWEKNNGREYVPTVTAAATDEAAEWEGWGTALKPAFEPIVLARKPLSEGTVAANVLKWRTGALNIDGCRIPSGQDHADKCASVVGLDSNRNGACYGEWSGARSDSFSPQGRWPANVVTDGSDEVVGMFPETETNAGKGPYSKQHPDHIYGKFNNNNGTIRENAGNSGSAARFFYSAKANLDDRLGSRHPTVKPVDLMQWLIRLVTPKGGTVLDPFAGTGTTAEAAFREGMRCVLIEREDEYLKDIRRRMGLVLGGPEERKRESIKAKDLPFDPGPLFAN